MWRGVVPNIARCSVISCCEMVTYDIAKTKILASGWLKDNIFCHLACGFTAGAVSVMVGNPVEVLKTRIMEAQAGVKYSGVFDCAWQTLKNEGPLAFYSGFIPNFVRIVSWNTVCFVVLEQVRRAANSVIYGNR